MKRIFTFIFLLTTLLAGAQIPKPLKNTFVNDFAHVLTKADITSLNQQIFKLQQQSGVQLAVVLVNKIPKQYDIEDFSLLIGRKWHVGTQKRGLVYVAAINQHLQRIEVARNLDSVFTGAKCTAILAGMKDAYRNKDYAGGLQILISQVNDELAPPAQAGPAQPAAAQAALPPADNDSTLNFVVGLLVIVAIPVLIVLYYRRRARQRRINDFFYQQQIQQGYNPDYNGPYNNGTGNYGYGRPHSTGSAAGNFVAGAIIGGAAGYAARAIQDDMNYNDQQNFDDTPTDDNNTPIDNSSNTPDNWGNWGSSDSSSNDYSSSDNSGYDSSSSSDSSGDSGFSSSDDSSGASSSW